MTFATVITDASFDPKTHAAGWACWITMNGHRFKHGGNFRSRPRHSTEAEFWAALNGIDLARRWGATDILAQTDCENIVVRLNRRVKEVRAVLSNGERLLAKHVKGHSRIKQAKYWCNNWCDREAKKFMRKQRREG